MFCVELDVSPELTYQEAVSFADERNCNATLVTNDGRCGPNPVYEFTSNEIKNVMQLIADIYGMEIDSEVLKTMIVEV
jgi:hypothetical protein